MSQSMTEDPALRAVNAKIAAAYEHVPYDDPAILGIDPAEVFGVAALYGAGPAQASFDVLDLGCGRGKQLERVGAMTTGRLVGTDLSQAACDLAAARCAALGSRCRIVCADFLDLDPSDLGQFDLIYNIGVLYVTPPEVQRRILEMIAACLKPGGVAVISYYFGTAPLLMGGLQQMLKLAVDPTAAPAAQIAAARARLQEIAAAVGRQGGDQRAMMAVLQQVNARGDTIFFHEMLNQAFTAISTSSLESALGAHGVHFLSWMPSGSFGAIDSPRERALSADVTELTAGNYHYSVFAKGPAGETNPRVPTVRWQTRLARTGQTNEGKPVFRDPALGLNLNAAAVTATALDRLATGPLSWTDVAAGLDAEALAKEFRLLWQHTLLAPLWTPES